MSFVLCFLNLVGLVPMLSSAVPVAAKAPRDSAWTTFRSKQLGLTFRYPRGWSLAPGSAGGPDQQITVAQSGAQSYSLTAILLPFRAQPSLAATVQRFQAYEKAQTQSSMYDQLRWTSVSVGHERALGGVLHPPTEGGTPVSEGVYVTQWRQRAYEFEILSTRRPVLTQITRFPSVYRQILASVRFLP